MGIFYFGVIFLRFNVFFMISQVFPTVVISFILISQVFPTMLFWHITTSHVFPVVVISFIMTSQMFPTIFICHIITSHLFPTASHLLPVTSRWHIMTSHVNFGIWGKRNLELVVGILMFDFETEDWGLYYFETDRKIFEMIWKEMIACVDLCNVVFINYFVVWYYLKPYLYFHKLLT